MVFHALTFARSRGKCYYCIKTFCDARKLDNFKENALENSYFWRLNFHKKGTFTAFVLITPLPGHKQRDV